MWNMPIDGQVESGEFPKGTYLWGANTLSSVSLDKACIVFSGEIHEHRLCYR